LSLRKSKELSWLELYLTKLSGVMALGLLGLLAFIKKDGSEKLKPFSFK
jgi:hypothetical protein